MFFLGMFHVVGTAKPRRKMSNGHKMSMCFAKTNMDLPYKSGIQFREINMSAPGRST